ncbi:MAG: formylglycine-generating enzyme family protein [Phycisphaerales bacterium]|nr:SUMF1/EgtB/PvdO family nonheme iron enzyme [Planctomycetota bacterium]MCH8508692.1 formylglycine-generating enzyme family protein [Phycisphaerales bacterium]
MLLLVAAGLGVGSGPAALAEPLPGERYETRTLRVPGTTVSFDLVRCPAPGDEAGSLWVLRTEVPWELYDIFVYRLDQPQDDQHASDAIARPSKPYVPPDRGFGHQGYPAMGMTRSAAEGFCVWLSEVTGIPFRLPTDDEWTHLASAGGVEAFEPIDEHAWTADNAEFTTHPVGRKRPNAFGLHDMLGNVAEWVMTDTRRPQAMGGSYRDPPEQCTPQSMMEQDRSWNASDPQIPKSQWWLADCSWVGFRFVTEAEVPEQEQ